MILAIIIGKGGNDEQTLPYKNTRCLHVSKLINYPMFLFPILAAKRSKYIDGVAFCTDSDELKREIDSFDIMAYKDPDKLNKLGEDIFKYVYEKEKYLHEEYLGKFEFIVTMFANAPCITGAIIDEMVTTLRNNPDADSICTVSNYDMFPPYRARKITNQYLKSYIDGCDFTNVSCDRKSCEKTWYYDCSCAVVKPHCLDDLNYGQSPMRWLGQKILAYKYDAPVCDVDEEWQIPQVTKWLRKNWR